MWSSKREGKEKNSSHTKEFLRGCQQLVQQHSARWKTLPCTTHSHRHCHFLRPSQENISEQQYQVSRQIWHYNRKSLESGLTYFLTPVTFLCFCLFLAVLGLGCCEGFSLVVASRTHSSLQCTGFSLQWLLLWRSRVLGCVGFSSCSTWAWCCSWALEHRLESCGFVAPQQVGSSWTRDRSLVSYIGRQILYH